MSFKKDVGAFFFFLGIILSLILGFFNLNESFYKISVILIIISGFLCGILNLDDKKLNNFLISASSLILATLVFNFYVTNLIIEYLKTGSQPAFLNIIKNTLSYLSLFISSSVIFPALKRSLKLVE